MCNKKYNILHMSIKKMYVKNLNQRNREVPYNLCVASDALHPMRCIRCVASDALHPMHCIRCVASDALHPMRCI